jgi:hypothetical protein
MQALFIESHVPIAIENPNDPVLREYRLPIARSFDRRNEPFFGLSEFIERPPEGLDALKHLRESLADVRTLKLGSDNAKSRQETLVPSNIS